VKAIVAAICLLSLSACVRAQAPRADAEYRDKSAGGAWAYVRNQYSRPLTAFRIVQTFTHPRSGQEISPQSSFDLILEVTGQGPIQPGEWRFSGFGAPRGSKLIGVRVDGAIFSDGASFGDPQWISGIIDQRRKMKLDIPVIASLLREGMAAKDSVPGLIDRVRKFETFSKAQDDNEMIPGFWASYVAFATVSTLTQLQSEPEITPELAAQSTIERLKQWGETLQHSKPPL
jgi:hypothetical protein